MWAPNADWSSTLTALSFVQRLGKYICIEKYFKAIPKPAILLSVSFVYYYTCKHTSLVVSDPRYYDENIDWIAEQLSDK